MTGWHLLWNRQLLAANVNEITEKGGTLPVIRHHLTTK